MRAARCLPDEAGSYAGLNATRKRRQRVNGGGSQSALRPQSGDSTAAL